MNTLFIVLQQQTANGLASFLRYPGKIIPGLPVKERFPVRNSTGNLYTIL